MNKKNLTIVIVALILGAIIFGAAGTAYAQTSTPEVEEVLPAPVVNRHGYGYRYQIQVEDGEEFSFGPCDGTCDGEALGFGPGDGTCDADGDGIPDQLRLRDGSAAGNQYGMGKGQGAGMGLGAGMGTGTGQGYGAGAGMGAGRGAGGSGLGMGPGEGLGDGLGTHDGSCLDD
jgi:hypothetical protein